MAEKSLSLDELVRKLMGDDHADVLRETLAWFVGELTGGELRDPVDPLAVFALSGAGDRWRLRSRRLCADRRIPLGRCPEGSVSDSLLHPEPTGPQRFPGGS